MGEQDEEKLVLPGEKASSKASRNRRREPKEESMNQVESKKASSFIKNFSASV
jgi:hypothetical protein